MRIKKEGGQVLLVTVMLIATAITIILTVSFKAVTESQSVKLQEDSRKALAAAEAGIEKVLQSGESIEEGSIGQEDVFVSASILCDQAGSHETQLLEKDQQYTFYLSNFPAVDSGSYMPCDKRDFTQPSAVFSNKTITVCFGSQTDRPGLEITFVNSANKITRIAVNPSGGGAASVVSGDSGTVANSSGVNNTSCPGYKDSYDVSTGTVIDNYTFMFVRVLGGSTKLKFISTVDLPFQGRYAQSEAKTRSGATKRLRMFQSYPQIPAEFFVTSF